MELKKDFAIGTKIKVQENAGWLDQPVGIVSSAPEPIKTRQGKDYLYWVRFDPSAQDSDGDGPYKSGQILSRYLDIEGDIRYEVADPEFEARTVAWIFSRAAAENDEAGNHVLKHTAIGRRRREPTTSWGYEPEKHNSECREAVRCGVRAQ